MIPFQQQQVPTPWFQYRFRLQQRQIKSESERNEGFQGILPASLLATGWVGVCF